MALPTLTKTWQFNCNNQILAQGTFDKDMKALLRAIKNAMIGFGTNPWTVVGSSDSTTAGIDGVDRWSADSKIVWAGTVNPHSWIVLKQTGIGSNFQFLISCGCSSTSAQGLQIKISPAVGFTGGSASADPTASDSITTANNGASGGNSWFSASTDVNLRWSVMQSTDGQCTRVLVFQSGIVGCAWLIDKLANPTGGTPGTTNAGICCQGSNNTNLTAGVMTQNSVATTTAISAETGSNLTIASEVSGVWDILPYAAVGTTVGARGRLGTFQDSWIVSSSLPAGDNFPLTGSPVNQFIVTGYTGNSNCLWPWNNGTINTS